MVLDESCPTFLRLSHWVSAKEPNIQVLGSSQRCQTLLFLAGSRARLSAIKPLCFDRFQSIFMAIPAVGVSLLLVLVLMVIIRVWMVGAPKYTRKCERFPSRFHYPNPDDKLRATPR